MFLRELSCCEKQSQLAKRPDTDMICIDRDAVCYEKSICYGHIEGTGNHQASEAEKDAGGKLAQWHISFETPSDLWGFVELLNPPFD